MIDPISKRPFDDSQQRASDHPVMIDRRTQPK